MYENGIKLKNTPGRILATKVAKDINYKSKSQKGERVPNIEYCNTEGTLIPPGIIMKGAKQKAELSNAFPPDSEVFTNPKSSYISVDLSIKWLKKHFASRKCPS